MRSQRYSAGVTVTPGWLVMKSESEAMMWYGMWFQGLLILSLPVIYYSEQRTLRWKVAVSSLSAFEAAWTNNEARKRDSDHAWLNHAHHRLSIQRSV